MCTGRRLTLGLATRFVSAVWVDMMTTAQIATTPATAPSTAYLRALRLCAAPAIGSASDDTIVSKRLFACGNRAQVG